MTPRDRDAQIRAIANRMPRIAREHRIDLDALPNRYADKRRMLEDFRELEEMILELREIANDIDDEDYIPRVRRREVEEEYSPRERRRHEEIEEVEDFRPQRRSAEFRSPRPTTTEWICPKGHRNLLEVKFCSECGAPKEAQAKSEETSLGDLARQAIKWLNSKPNKR